MFLRLKSNRRRCHGYRVTIRVDFVTVDETSCHSYRITEPVAMVTALQCLLSGYRIIKCVAKVMDNRTR
jgi:hypothetical protein